MCTCWLLLVPLVFALGIALTIFIDRIHFSPVDFYTVMKYGEQIGEGRADAGGPVRGISISRRNVLGYLGFGLIHTSQGNMSVDKN